MKYIIMLLAVLFCFQKEAMAISAFKKEFFKMHVDKDSTDPKKQEFAKAANAKTGKCYICHVNVKNLDEKGLKKKSVRNNYGKAISKFVTKDSYDKAKKEDKEKASALIIAAIMQAGLFKSNPLSTISPTFDELISDSKLPGNGRPDADDLKKAIKDRDSKK